MSSRNGSRAYGAFDFRFTVTGSCRVLVPEVCRILRSLETADSPDGLADIRLDYLGGGLRRLSIDGVPKLRTADAGAVLHRMIYEITHKAVESRPDRLVLHACAAEIDGRPVVILGPSGAGKSTLVSALCAAGAGYLTDEAVEMGDRGEVVDALSRPIQLSPASLEMTGTVVPPTQPRHPDGSAYVPLDGAWTSHLREAIPTLIVLGQYGEGPAGVFPIARPDAVIEMIHNSFPPGHDTQRGLDIALRVARHSRVVELRGGNLQERCRAVRLEVQKG